MVAQRDNVTFLKRALTGMPALGCAFGVVAAALTVLFVPMPIGTLAILAATSPGIYLLDAVMAAGPTRERLRILDAWDDEPTPERAHIAWNAVAELPLAPLRRGWAYPVVFAAIVAWDLFGLHSIGLSAGSLPLLFPGSVLVWLNWLALRYLLTELLIRPVLADLSAAMPHDTPALTTRVTLNRRLLIAVPLTIIVTGTVVTGVVGAHTIESIALGIGASVLVAVLVASWPMMLLASSMSAPIGQLRAAAERLGRGDLSVRVPIVSLDEVGVLTQTFNAMAAGLRERERIRAAFGTYLDSAVADHILREGTALTGTEVEVTALFLDVRGFTSFAERHPADQVVAALNDLFERVVPIVHRNGGHVDKFVGDGLLAVFGAPRVYADHADRALTTAIHTATAIDGHSELRIGIGLNSGRVIAGNIGGAGRFDYSVIGDAINVAARVESATRQTGDTILLTDQTRIRLRNPTESNFIARTGISLKGKSDPVTLYAPKVIGRLARVF